MNERILFPLKRNPLPLTVIKDLFKIYIHEIEKLLPVERIFDKLEKKWLGLPRKSVFTSQNKEFPLKINLFWRKKALTAKTVQKCKQFFDLVETYF